MARKVGETALYFLRRDAQTERFQHLSLKATIVAGPKRPLVSELQCHLEVQSDITFDEYCTLRKEVEQHTKRSSMYAMNWQYYYTPRMARREKSFVEDVAQEALHMLRSGPFPHRDQNLHLRLSVRVRMLHGRKLVVALLSCMDEFIQHKSQQEGPPAQ